MDDNVLQSEIKECQKAVSQFHLGRRDFQQKISKIAAGIPEKTLSYETRQVNQAYRDQKERQEAAAQNSKTGHIITKSASVSPTVAAWDLCYNYTLGENIPEPIIDNAIKSASTEEPYFVTTMSNSPTNRSQNISTKNTTKNLKQASKDDVPSWATCFDYIINKEIG